MCKINDEPKYILHFNGKHYPLSILLYEGDTIRLVCSELEEEQLFEKEDKCFLDKSSEIVSEEISELLERILHEFVFLNGLYCTDREDIVEKIKTMEEDVIWQINEKEMIKTLEKVINSIKK